MQCLTCVYCVHVPTATNSLTPMMLDDRSVPNLSSKYLESSEYRAMSAMLEPIVDRVDVCNSNYSMNCATDSYATNILWQVRTCKGVCN